MNTAIGSMRMPAWSAENPSTSWRYWVPRNICPNMAKNTRVMAMLAAVKRRFRKNRTSSIGWSLVSSQVTKAPSAEDADDERDQHRRRRPSPDEGASMMA